MCIYSFLSVLREAKKNDIELWLNDGKLNYRTINNEINKELKEKIIQHKEGIINWLKLHDEPLSQLLIPINREEKVFLPITHEQLLFWRASQFSEFGYEYNIPYAYLIEGQLDIDKFQQALELMVENNPILKMHFCQKEGVVYQKEISNFELPFLQARIENNEYVINSYCENLAKTVFNLDYGPCYLIHLLKISESKYLLCMVFHHIIADATSLNLMFSQIKNNYENLSTHSNNLINSVEYLDYAYWQKYSKTTPEDIPAFISQNFSEICEKSTLPYDKGRVTTVSQKGRNYKFEINEDTTNKIKRFSEKNNVSLNVTLLSIYFVLLRRYSRNDKHCVGISLSTRNSQQKNSLFGPMLNSAALVSTIDLNMNLIGVVKHVNEQLAEAISAFISTPYHQALDDMAENNKQSTELFNTMFLVQPFSEEKFELENCNIAEIDFPLSFSKFDITFSIRDKEKRLIVNIEYKTELFSEEVIQEIGKHYISIARQLLSSPNKPIFEITLVDKIKKYPGLDLNEKNIFNQIKDWVKNTPDAIAIYDEENKLTYSELWQRASLLSESIKKHTHNDLVGILLDRSINAIVGIVAVIISGKAFVPIDVNNPAERIKYIIDDASLDLVLVNSHSINVPISKVQKIRVDTLNFHNAISDATAEPTIFGLSYLIYTSGSSGKPKGVMVSNSNLIHYNNWAKNAYISKYNVETVLLHSSLAFDLTITCIFAPLTSGKSIFVPADDGLVSLPEYYKQNEDLGLLKVTPSHLRLLLSLLEEGEIKNKTGVFIVGGEALYAGDIKPFLKLSPNLIFINEYGPTETTVGCSVYTVTCENIDKFREDDPIPVGLAIDRMDLQVVDENNQPCPAYIPGEIIISGLGVTNGYINNTEITNERFGLLDGIKFYKSADLAFESKYGEIIYLGRVDQQIKLNGFRVELGEIESLLLSIENIKQACVILIEQQLVAFIVVRSHLDEFESTVRQIISEKIPYYMQPKNFIVVNEIPLTLNGKIDYSVLINDLKKNKENKIYLEEKTTGTELNILCIWKEIFQIEQIDLNSSFFELGGDSIKVLKMTYKMREHGYQIKPSDIYKYFTVHNLASYIDSLPNNTTSQVKKTYKNLDGKSQSLLPAMMWFANLKHRNINHYNQSFRFAFKITLNKEYFLNAIEKVIKNHPALWLRYDSDKKRAFYSSAETTYDVSEIDLFQNKKDSKAVINDLHRSLDLLHGPVLKFCFLNVGDDVKELLIIAHHFVIDAVSWGILLEELNNVYLSMIEGNKTYFLAKEETTLMEWYHSIKSYLSLPYAQKTKDYWKKIVNKKIENFFVQSKSFELSEYHKEEIIINKRYLEELCNQLTITPDALLLGVFLSALDHGSERKEVLITLEHHGRELIKEDIDLSRTVGWFTAQYPVNVTLPMEINEDYLLSLSSKLKNVPDNGLGFGVLKYLYLEPELQQINSDICFNYLGEAVNFSDNASLTYLCKETGITIDPNLKRQFVLEVNCYLQDGNIIFEFFYDKNQIQSAWIKKFKEDLNFSYEKIIHSLINKEYILNLTNANNDITEFELSPLQRGLLFHSVNQSDELEYITQIIWDINQVVDVSRLMKAWRTLVSKAEVLRTIYSLNDENGTQVVLENCEPEMAVFNLVDTPEEEKNSNIKKIIAEQRKKPFNLFEAPPSRIALVLLSEDKSIFIWTHNHIMVDGWSIGNLKSLFVDVYEGRSIPQISYRPYINYLSQKKKNGSCLYWQGKLSGYKHKLMPKLSVASTLSEVGEIDFSLTSELSKKITQFSSESSVTPNSIFQAVWALLLGHYKGTSDVVYGMTFSHRPYEIAQIDNAIGLYINTLPMRIIINEVSFLDFVKEIQLQILEVVENGSFGVQEIAENCGIKKASYLINEIVVYESYPQKIIKSSQLNLENIRSVERTASGLVLVVAPGNEYKCKISFDRKNYSVDAIQRIQAQLVNMLGQVVKEPSISVQDIRVAGTDELNKMLVEWNDTETDFPNEMGTIQDYLEVMAETCPEKMAVFAEQSFLSYGELNSLSNKYAQILLKNGLSKGDRCVLHLKCSLHLFPVIYAILKCGGVLVPVDIEYPDLRKKEIISDSKPELIITDRDEYFDGFQSLSVEKMLKELDKIQIEQLLPDVCSTDLAYIIYTSGSTGKPKGVQIDHSSATNMIEILKNKFHLSHDSKVLMFASISFDASIADWTSTIAAGGILYTPLRSSILDPSKLVDYINKYKINTVTLPPSMLAILSENALPTVKVLVSAGESCPPSIPKRWANGRIFINGYGPSEATVCTSMSTLKGNEDIITIGRPLPNKKIYILDKDKKPVAIGAPGEIYISGKGIANGYLNQDVQTKASFLVDTFNSKWKMYKTGDFARWLENGEIEYLGRADSQVQLRGYRVELTEITKVLEMQDEVAQAYVKVFGNTEQQSLVAFVVPRSFSKLNIHLLKSHVKKHLPGYMVPQKIALIEKLPLTANGKVAEDMLCLPTEVEIKRETLCLTNTQESILNIFVDLFEHHIELDDDFFDLGGHSLLVVKLVNEIEKRMQFTIQFTDVFELRTPENISTYIDEISNIGKPSKVNDFSEEELVL